MMYPRKQINIRHERICIVKTLKRVSVWGALHMGPVAATTSSPVVAIPEQPYTIVALLRRSTLGELVMLGAVCIPLAMTIYFVCERIATLWSNRLKSAYSWRYLLSCLSAHMCVIVAALMMIGLRQQESLLAQSLGIAIFVLGLAVAALTDDRLVKMIRR